MTVGVSYEQGTKPHGCPVLSCAELVKPRRQPGNQLQSGADTLCICYTRTDERTHRRTAAQAVGRMGPMNRNLPSWGWVVAKKQPALCQQSAGTEAAGGSGAQAETQTFHIQQHMHPVTGMPRPSAPAAPSPSSPTAIPSLARTHNVEHTANLKSTTALSRRAAHNPKNPALPKKHDLKLHRHTHTSPTRQPAPCMADGMLQLSSNEITPP